MWFVGRTGHIQRPGTQRSLIVRNILHLCGPYCCLVLAGCAHHSPFASRTFVDLTHAFDAETIYWPTAEGFELEVESNEFTEKGYFYKAGSFRAAEHGGTHIDAPIHFYEGRHTLDAIPIEQLIGPGVVVDVSKQCAAERDYRVTVDDFVAWEKQHGLLLNDVIVLLRTGFGKHWPDRVKYLGTAERGPEAVPKLHFPGLHPDAAAWLVTRRRIKAIGLDTASIDYGQSTLFQSHVNLFEQNVPAFENLANLDKLPATGFTVIALPMKIKGGSGGPLRIIAVLDP